MCELSYNFCCIYDVTYNSERGCLLNQRFHNKGRSACQAFTAAKEIVLNAGMGKKELI